MKLFPCAHRFDSHELHRFTDEIVAGLCWKCDRVFTANCGLHLPGQLQERPKVCCPRCAGLGKVHALTVSASGESL
jgi:hypothetical protein